MCNPTGKTFQKVATALLLAAGVPLASTILSAAINVPEGERSLPPALQEALAGLDLERYDVRPQPMGYGFDAAQVELRGWQGFRDRHGREWRVEVDARTRVPLLISGQGIPWVPGSGNQLENVPLAPSVTARDRRLTLADLDVVASAFMERNRALMGIVPDALVFDEDRSVGLGRNGRFWSLRYQAVLRDPELGLIPVRGAYVFFRVSQGNLIQFGNHLAVKPEGIDTGGIIGHEDAASRARELMEGVDAARIEGAAEKLDQGDPSLQVVPLNAPDGSLDHQLVRSILVGSDQFAFELWFDAHSGKLVYALNRLLHADALVRGGIYPVTNTDPEVLRGLPFLTVVNDGTPKTTDEAGVYDYAPPGSLASSSLEGDFVSIDDHCGTASVSTSFSPGDVSFGSGAGTDCDTPGFGGPGNTHSARSTYYHLNLIMEKGRRYLNDPMVTTPWLEAQLTANVNVNDTCNAGWNPGTGEVSFYKSGAGCSNTGEIAAVFLHEYGHGLDQNTNGAPPEHGSGEAYSDTLAFLQTHDPCIGANFRPGVPCPFGCDLTCTGVRDVSVAPEVSPATIANSPANCDAFACPYLSFGIFPYQGPMGYQGHCESLIASGAVWDMIQGFVGRYGDGAGWALGDRIWYESLYQTGSAYQLVSGGKCNPAATVDGCGPDNWYTVFLALDDDNGNLADGTPNADLIWNAFNAHGIACGAAAPPVSSTCPSLTAPTLTVTPTGGQVDLSWTAVTGAASYRVFRNEFGCDQGFTPIADVSAPTTSFTDTGVANGTEYFYAVQAVGTNDACVSGFSTCNAATPPAPLLPADVFMVLDQSGSMSGATDLAGEQKIDALQDAGRMVIDLVEPYAADGFRLGGVSFSTDVTGTESLKDLSIGAEKLDLQNFITGLTPTNLTAIGKGLNQAIASFPPASFNRKAVMLLSDGIQNVPPLLELQTPPPGAALGGSDLPADIRFYTVALGTNIQEDLFDDLANTGGIPGFYYGGGTSEIQGNFALWVADVLGLQPGSPFAPGGGEGGFAPFVSGASESGAGTSFLVNRTVRRVTFLVTWTAKGTDLRFHLETPAGRIDPSPGSFHADEGYATHTVQLPLTRATTGGAPDHVGEWTVVVTGPQGEPPQAAYQVTALFDDPALGLEYRAAGEDPGAGEPLPLEVRITENGRGLGGLDVRARVVGPDEGLGEVLSDRSLDPQSLGRASPGPGDRFPGDAWRKLAVLLEEDPDLLSTSSEEVVLSEVTPGIYRATVPASRTSAAGSYEFDFRVGGAGVANEAFRRTQRFSRYLRIKPAPEATEIRAELLERGDLWTYRVIAVPRDAGRRRLGPGWAAYVRASVTPGSAGDAVDRLDGSYGFEVRAPAGTDPEVLVEVLGEAVGGGRISTLEAGGARPTLWYEPFVGWTFFDSVLPIDDGLVLGGRWRLDLSDHWSLETEFGSTFTEDEVDDDGVVLQASQNALYWLTRRSRPVLPFVTAGVGSVVFSGFSQDDAALAFNFGVGVEVPLRGDAAFRLDLRNYMADDAYGTGSTDNLQATAGVNLGIH